MSLVEWLLAGPVLFLSAAALERLPWLDGWSYGGLAALLVVPACVVHYFVLRAFLTLRVDGVRIGHE